MRELVTKAVHRVLQEALEQEVKVICLLVGHVKSASGIVPYGVTSFS